MKVDKNKTALYANSFLRKSPSKWTDLSVNLKNMKSFKCISNIFRDDKIKSYLCK